MERDSSQALIEQQEAAITELERDGILHIVCPICNLYFPDTTSGRATRNKHIHQIHNTQKNTTQSNKLPTLPKEHQFQCPHCLETRSSWYEFDLHKKQHELIKCCVCGKTMTSEGGLQLHFRKFHAVKIIGPRADGGPLGKYKRYKCPLETCEFYTTYVPTFKDTAILMSHFEGAHPEKCKFWHDDELVDGTENEASGGEDSDGDDEDEGDLEGEDDDVEDELHDEDDGQTTCQGTSIAARKFPSDL
ncbi:hypothetical protein B0J14DRAFT_564100 [Halenospora varia]|nr:hypothetical protein B0J14DRAFT_564100 [Halenospora varia]